MIDYAKYEDLELYEELNPEDTELLSTKVTRLKPCQQITR